MIIEHTLKKIQEIYSQKAGSFSHFAKLRVEFRPMLFRFFKLFLVGVFLISTVTVAQAGGPQPDLSVVIYEQNLNKLLGAVGPISGKGPYNIGISSGEFNWEVRNPRIEIQNGQARFVADTKVNAGFFNYSPQTKGNVDIQYDAKRNKIKVKVTRAEFEVYLEFFGSRTHITDVDITPFYKQEFEFDGIELAQTKFDVQIAENKTKTIYLSTNTPTLSLEKGKIVLSTQVVFSDQPSK